MCIAPIPEGCTFQHLYLKIFASLKKKINKVFGKLISDEITKNLDFKTLNMKYDFILSAVIGKKTTPALLEIILYETQRSSVKES